MRTILALRRWICVWSHDSDANEPIPDAVVAAGPTRELSLSDMQIARAGSWSNCPLDGGWQMTSNEDASSSPKRSTHFFVISGSLLLTPSRKTHISRCLDRPDAFRWKSSIIELDSNDILRVSTDAGAWKFYERLDLPSEVLLGTLQGCWSSSKPSLFRGLDIVTIHGAFWQAGAHEKDRGVVYVRRSDGLVVIHGQTASLSPHGDLLLKSPVGRTKNFSRSVHSTLWIIPEA